MGIKIWPNEPVEKNHLASSYTLYLYVFGMPSHDFNPLTLYNISQLCIYYVFYK